VNAKSVIGGSLATTLKVVISTLVSAKGRMP